MTRARVFLFLGILLLLPAVHARTALQTALFTTSPRQHFGAGIGDDYFLATYAQLESYWQLLARQSDRMQLVDIGRTEEGRPQWMAIVSAPENLRRLDRLRDISRQLALAEGIGEDQARALAEDGRAVVWIDGGLHADEVLAAQQLIETVYQLVSRSDAETLRILRDVIVLAVHANPDGHELVANWYMREPDPQRRSLEGLPRLYQKYVGHDNNRDFYMATQAETINMNRVLYREWHPQIVFNHHQPSPPGTVMFAPPFRGPFNYVLDPLVPASVELIGAAMHARFAAEGKPGVTMRGGAEYSSWWNGGLRTTAYFHNQMGLLTETLGGPTPMDIPVVPERQLPSPDLPFPIAPQRWHFRQAVTYSLTANRAVLDWASRYRETLLFNAWRMGRNGIERGSRDSWTPSPQRVAALREDLASRGAGSARLFEERLRDPQLRDPRGYILPADQPDFLTATRFVDALLKAGVTVHRATADFTVGRRTYPRGSYVVRTAQAFRPHVLDMFEPQDHPDDTPYPGGPPTPPYDSAGWTLAFTMGVRFDRILDGFEGPFEVVDAVSPPAGGVDGPPSPAGYLVSHHQNDAFTAVNRLLGAGERVYWPRDRRVGGGPAGTGAMYVPAGPATRTILERAAADLGLRFTGVAQAPPGDALRIRPVRVGLWDRYGGSSSSGWIRWVLEQFEFPFDLVHVQALDAGDLARRFDVIVFSDDAIPVADGSRRNDGSMLGDRLPPEYRHTTGSLTWATTVPALREFVEGGGTIIAFGGAAVMAEPLGAPVTIGILARDGRSGRLPRDEFFVPGSVLRVRVDNTAPLAYGFESHVDVFFDDSPVFRLPSGTGASSPRRVAWFDSARPLRSGWALGQHHLEGAVAVVEAPVGRGRVLIFGPAVAFRAQSHGTFKFLFNGILSGAAVPERIGEP